MKLEVKAVNKLEEGKYEGVITAVGYRTTPNHGYEYVDIEIETQDQVKLRAGFPKVISTSSGLGKLLIRFGAVLEVGSGIDPDEILIGKQCSFMVKQDGDYSKIIPDTVKPK